MVDITDTINSFQKHIDKIDYRNDAYLRNKQDLILEVSYLKQAYNELEKHTVSLKRLQDLYARIKDKATSQLLDSLNSILNTTFYNSYHLKLEYNKMKTACSLKDSTRPGPIKMICGGGARQTIGIVTALSIIRTKGSKFLSLDEAFSNYGLKEIENIPPFLKSMDDIQLLIIEHKEQLIDSDSFPCLKLILARDLKTGTYIHHIVDPYNEVDKIMEYIHECEKEVVS